MKNTLSLLCMAALAATLALTPNSALATESSVIFRSGFEPGSTPDNAVALRTISGTDHSTGFSWTNDLNQHPDIGFWRVEYTGGTNEQRWARIIDEPGNPGNKVLWFNIIEPNASNGNGRVQVDMYGNGPIRDFTLKNRLFLHPDLQVLVDHDDRFTFFTVFEFWNNPNWTGDPYPFRIAVNLRKDAGAGSPLYFGVKGQQDVAVGGSQWVTLWEELNRTPVPLGKWLDLELRLAEGDDFSGRFSLVMTIEGGEQEELFDLVTLTQHPNNPNPNGFTHINPQKLYTNPANVNRVRNAGGSVQVYWDDFELIFNEPRDVDTSGRMTVTTNTGRGADTRVVNAGLNRENFNAGAEESLLIRRAAGPGSTSVAYLRFDLDGLERPFREANLVLVPFGNLPETAASLRIYGLENSYTGDTASSKAGEDWVEGTKTFTLADPGEMTGFTAPGFDHTTAQMVDPMTDLGAVAVGVGETEGMIEFSSPALVDYLNADTTGLVTFALAFDQPVDGIRIYAKEGGITRAPRLQLMPADAWAGYPRDVAGWSDTGAWLGLVWSAPGLDWIWIHNLRTWAYLAEDEILASGGWFYLPRR